MMSKVKVIVSDLDGTLINDQQQLHQSTIDAFVKAQQKGILCVIATGRELDTTMSYAQQLKLDQYNGYIVAFNGQMVVSCASQEIHIENSISPKASQAIYRYLKKHQFYAVFENQDTNFIVAPFKLKLAKKVYEFIRKFKGSKSDSNIENLDKRTYVYVSDVKQLDQPISKIGIRWTGFSLQQHQAEIIKRFSSDISFSRVDAVWVDLIPKGINKAVGLRKISEWTQIDVSNFMAFGNAENDKEMLELVGVGYVVENALESLKQGDFLVAPSNNDHGVAQIIQVILNEDQS